MLNGRDPRIDFFRGLALIFIFWDHVPHNPLGQITLRNLGFSDAAEVFVFLAGFASVMAYGKVLQRDFDGDPDRLTEMDALVAYLQMLGTLVDFSTYQAEAPENRR